MDHTFDPEPLEPLDPKAYLLPGYPEFSARADILSDRSMQPLTHQQFLELAREAVSLKKRHPILRMAIAYHVVSAGAGLEETESKQPGSVFKELWDLFADVEIPDYFVVPVEARERGDFSEVQRKWDRIEEILDSHIQPEM